MTSSQNSVSFSAEAFQHLAQQGYNRIPLVRQILADTETPVSCYLKLANAPYSYLLESVQGGEKWSRYSIIGLPCKKRIEVRQQELQFFEDEKLLETQTHADPLKAIETFQSNFKLAPCEHVPRFLGGLVGYFAYDCVRYSESKLANSTPEDTLALPDIVLLESEEVLVFDNLSGVIYLVVIADPAKANAYENGIARLQQLEAALHQQAAGALPIKLMTNDSAVKDNAHELQFTSSFGEDNFKQAVAKIKEYILAGDCMQVVLAQRLGIEFKHKPFDLYRVLRHLNPSPYMYYLNLGELDIVGASPEVLVRVEDDIVSVRPIAGTRRRGHDAEEDLALEQELLADPKELAEHLMLIDLGRNDVGRVSKTASVKVTEQYAIERYSHVMHIVSNVNGELLDNLSSVDALKAILPAGTLSGAPKVRAMEIIDELEPVKRGIYGGAIGYLSWNGEMDTAIAIRTAVIHKQTLHVQAGAGVVADSDPALEWKETMNKARAIFKAVQILDVAENEVVGSKESISC